MRTFTFKSVTAETPLLLVASIAIAAILALAHFIALPQLMEWRQNQRQLERYQSLISSENGYQLIKQEITEKISVLARRLEPPRTELKKGTADIGGYLEMLIALARTADIRFTRIQPDDEVTTADYSEYPVALVLTATYHELGRFLAALEKSSDLFTVSRLAMDAAADGKCNVRLMVSCLIPREGTHD